MNKTARNIIYNVLYQFMNIAIPLVTAPYISRAMGPTGVGVYSYSTSVASLFAVFMLLGVANYGSRSVARVCTDGKETLSRVFSEIYVFQLATSFVVILLYFVYATVAISEYKNALFAQVFYLCGVLLDISWYFAGTGQFKTTVTRGVVIKLLQAVLIFVVVKSPRDIILYILIMTIGMLAGNLALWPIMLRQIRLVKVSATGVFFHIRPNLVLFLPLLASSVFIYMDKIMLKVLTQDFGVLGYYENAEKIVRIPLGVISAIGAVMMPRISSIVSLRERGKENYYFSLSMRYISLLSSAMAFGVAAIAPELAIVYLGQDFAVCGELMRVMSCIIVISAFANVLRTQYLIPRNKDFLYSGSIIAGAVVNLVLNCILIPKFGSIGAAIGTIGAEMGVLIGHVFGVRNELKLKPFIVDWILALFCGGMMFLAVRGMRILVDNAGTFVVIGVVIGIISFMLLAGVLLYLRRDELLLKEVLKKRK